MKEITSRKTKLIQVITDETWDWIIAEGFQKRFKVVDIPQRTLRTPPVISTPEEIKTTKKSKS